MIYKITLIEKSTGVEIQTTEKTLKRVCRWLKDRVINCYALSDCDLKVVRCYDEATPECVIIESIEDALNVIALEEETSNFYAERKRKAAALR